MDIGVIVAIGLAVLLANVLVVALFYAFGERQESSRPEPPEGHT